MVVTAGCGVDQTEPSTCDSCACMHPELGKWLNGMPWRIIWLGSEPFLRSLARDRRLRDPAGDALVFGTEISGNGVERGWDDGLQAVAPRNVLPPGLLT